MSKVNLIHKSGVYFKVLKPTPKLVTPPGRARSKMRHGDIYIYLNQIYISDEKHWYKMDIQDIKDIETILPRKQVLIHFWNYDMVLSCKKHSHLMALRDFLYISQNYFMSNNSAFLETKGMGGCSVH